MKSSSILRGNYRGYDLYGLGLPSFGAITIEIMQILEQIPFDPRKDEEWILAVYQAMRLGYRDRSKQFLGDTAVVQLTSQQYAKELADEAREHLSSFGQSKHQWDNDMEDRGHTTNLVTCDANGMMVVLTQSLGPIMGSKVATPGLGFMHATASGKYLRAYDPGMRTSSHISPMILENDGKPFLGIGAAGGSRIITAISNVISRMIDHQLPLRESMLAPRVFPIQDSIHLEVGTKQSWSEEIIDGLMDQGIPVTTKPDPIKFGIVHAILYDTLARNWVPAAEPDWDGSGNASIRAR